MISALYLRVSELYGSLLPRGSLGERFAVGAFWSLAGAIIFRGLNFAASVVTARFLGETGFGELGIIQSTVGMFGVFAGFGLGTTATKYLAEFREKDRPKAGRILALSYLAALVSGTAISLALVFMAPFLAANTLAAPHLTTPLRISAGILFFSALNGAQIGALAGFEAFKTIAKVNLLAGLMSFPIMVAGVWLWSLEGAVWGLVASIAISFLFSYLALRSVSARAQVRRIFSGCWSERAILWKFSLPAFLSSAMVGPVTWAANSILVNQPNGYAQMGILNAANQVRRFATFVPMTAFSALLPILSAELNRDAGLNEHLEMRVELHVLNVYSGWYIATAVAACLLFFVEPVLSLFGKGFLAGDLALTLVLCSIPILSYKYGIARLVQAKSMMWYAFASNLLWAAFLILGTLALAQYGAVGLGAAYLLAYSLNSIIMVPIYFRKLKLTHLIGMDAQLAILLGIALVPGVLVNLFSFSLWVKLIMIALSLCMLIWAGRKMRRWYDE